MQAIAALPLLLLIGCGIKAMPRPPQNLNEPAPQNAAKGEQDAGCFECQLPQNDH
jgi:hypothetical protein